MKKRFVIPLIGTEIAVFLGMKEYRAFCEQAKEDGADWLSANDLAAEPDCMGQVLGSNVWIGFPEKEGLVDHELSHLLDHLMAYLRTNDSEFRAYIAEWMGPTVRQWIAKVITRQ